MAYNYITYSIAIAFTSWIVALITTPFIRKTDFYGNHLSHLNFIKSDYINKIIGIGVVKWLVKHTFLRNLNPFLKLSNTADIADLKNLRKEMIKAEVDHLTGFAFVLLICLVELFLANFLFALTIMIVNIFMNLYPSLLQQLNKRRIDRLLKVVAARQESTSI